MPASPAAPRFLAATFQDVDSLIETAPGWDGSFFQLDRGKFHGELTQLDAGEAQLSRVRFGRRIRQAGTHPTGLLSFALARDADQMLGWRGRSAPREAILHFQPGSEVDAVSQPGFDVVVLSVSPALLERAALHLGVASVLPLVENHDAFSTASDRWGELRRIGETLLALESRNGTAARNPELRETLEHDLPKLLLQALTAGRANGPSGAPRLRDRAVQRSEDFLLAHPDVPVSVRELCEAIGVSERTLLYGFQERFGVSPKQYLQARRLAGLRRDLRASDARRTKVSDLANRWGFWHLGQLAADYRRMFDELPSETLGRRPGT